MSRGFTLAEMLVALTVFSLIAAAGVGLLSGSLTAKERMEAADDRLRRLHLARTLMRSDLLQLTPRAHRLPDGRTRSLVFQGGQPRGPLLSLVRSGWDNPGSLEERTGHQAVDYALVGDRLIRRSWARLDADQGTPVTERVLLDGVRDLQMRFFRQGRWSRIWTASAGPRPLYPEIVEVRFDLAGIGPVRQLFATPGLRQ